MALSLAGSSHAKLQHLETVQLSITIAGSGDVQARELTAGDVSVAIAGRGDARVTAQKTLGVATAGSGDVAYGGAATLAKSSIVGSGTLRKRQP